MIDVICTGNTGPTLREIWAFISRDAEGRENAIAMGIPGVGMTQFVTGNPQTFELMKALVQRHREELEKEGQVIHLLRFSQREELSS